MSIGRIHTPTPVDPDYPLNAMRQAWLLPLPELAGGPVVWDLCGKNHATFNSTPTWTTGPTPSFGAVTFGVSNYAPLPVAVMNHGTADGKIARTVTAWVRCTANNGAILGCRDAGGNPVWDFGVGNNGADNNNTGKLTLLVRDNNSAGLTWIDGTTNINDSVWHRVCCVTDAAKGMAIYLDGKSQATGTHTMGVGLTFTNVRWGAESVNAGIPKWSGDMTDLSIHWTGFTAAMAMEDYCQAIQEFPDALRRIRPALGGLLTTAVAFDAASNSGYQAASSSYSWSHVVTGANTFLTVDVALLSAGQTVSSITYNGVALSLLGAKTTTTSFGRVESWGLAGPASGSNTITVTLSGSIASVGLAVSYTGVNQTVPTEAFNSNQATNGIGAADATVDVTTVTDQAFVHAALACSDGSVTAGQTSRNNVNDGGGLPVVSGANEDFGPQSVGLKTMSYTGVGPAVTWAIVGYGIRPVGGANNYTLTGSAAAFTWTGSSAGVAVARKVTGSAGSYTLTGGSAGLTSTRKLSGSAASYAVTGATTGLSVARKVTGSPASYTLTGGSAGVTATRRITGSTGSYTFTGGSAGLRVVRQLVAGAAGFSWTGSAAGLSVVRSVLASVASFTVTGGSATLTYVGAGSTYSLYASGASFAATGGTTSLSATRFLSGGPGSYTVTGVTAGLTAARKLNGSAASYAVTGSPAILSAARKLNGGSASYTFTGGSAGLASTRMITASAGGFVLSGGSLPLLKSHPPLVASAASLAVTALSTGLSVTRSLPALSATYTVSSANAGLSYSGDSTSGTPSIILLLSNRTPR